MDAGSGIAVLTCDGSAPVLRQAATAGAAALVEGADGIYIRPEACGNSRAGCETFRLHSSYLAPCAPLRIPAGAVCLARNQID